jgi:hypothetical protein
MDPSRHRADTVADGIELGLAVDGEVRALARSHRVNDILERSKGAMDESIQGESTTASSLADSILAGQDSGWAFLDPSGWAFSQWRAARRAGWCAGGD